MVTWKTHIASRKNNIKKYSTGIFFVVIKGDMFINTLQPLVPRKKKDFGKDHAITEIIKEKNKLAFSYWHFLRKKNRVT